MSVFQHVFLKTVNQTGTEFGSSLSLCVSSFICLIKRHSLPFQRAENMPSEKAEKWKWRTVFKFRRFCGGSHVIIFQFDCQGPVINSQGHPCRITEIQGYSVCLITQTKLVNTYMALSYEKYTRSVTWGFKNQSCYF